MASQFYVPGPAQVYTGTGASAAWQFLGWTIQGVEGRLMASFEDVRADYGGTMVPVDSQFMGEQAFVPMVLSQYVESVLSTVLKRRVGSGVTAGAIEAGGIGSLMIGQGYYFPLLIIAPYNSLSPFNTMVPCWWFKAAWLNDETTQPTSVRVKNPQLIFRCLPLWNAPAGTAQLYVNTLPSPTPTPV